MSLSRISSFIKTNIFLLTSIFVFFAASFVNLKYPGLQYDEVLFVNAALGGIGDDKSFIYKEFFGIPVFLMQYIGALKSYIYYPIFQIFGVSVYSIRIPTILISIGSLTIIYIAIKKKLNHQLANLIVLLLSLNAVFINLTRTDVGPNTIEFFLKSISIFILLNFRNYKTLFVLTLIFLLGVFNKLNFIWFVNAFLFAYFYLEYSSFNFQKISLTKLTQKLFLPILSWAAAISFVSYVNFSNSINSSLQFRFDLILKTFNNILEVVTQTAFFNYALGKPNTIISNIYLVFIFLLILSGILRIKKLKDNKVFDFYVVSWIFALLTFLQIVITPKSTAPWHWFTIEPFFTFIVATSLYTNLKLKKTFFLNILVITLLISYSIYQIFMHQNTYKNPKNEIWSPEIYSLIEFSKNSQNTFVSLDWGFHNQFIIFSQTSDKFIDLSFKLNTNEIDEETKNTFLNYATDENSIFVLHSPEDTIFKASRTNFFKILKENNIEFNLIKEYKQKDKTIYELYKTNKSIKTIDF